ncbi:hypothetical protein CPB83DRAFT_793914 [Crepidotus variabilis]|uniref:DUF6534 domain-containing protein n=1 Tax=Crepidotus variabilis TaxID=179855 RepID=A0A9P6EDP6_9AGAR|nr:hypothetical protein CPB83DRAFT_793914 [Crepidotus variabilis]
MASNEMAEMLLKVTGPLLIGHMLNWGLFGVLSVQTYIYHLAFPNDPIRSQLLSYGVYLLEATQTVMLTQAAFHQFAEGFGNRTMLLDVGSLWFTVATLSGIVSFIIQSFYAYRVFILSGSRQLAGLVLFFAVISLGGAVSTGVITRRAGSLDKLLGRDAYITSGIWNGGSAICDAIIAICMTMSLTKRKTGMAKTQTLVYKIIRMTVETGSLTAAVATLNLVLTVLPNRPGYFLAPIGILGKLYSTSMMAVFNSRIAFSLNNSSNALTSVELSTAVSSYAATASRNEQSRGQVPIPVQVKVTQEQVSFPSSDEPAQSFWDDKDSSSRDFPLAVAR